MPFDGSDYQEPNGATVRLDQVIDLLSGPERWCQRRLRAADGRRCLLGAIRETQALSLKLPILRAIQEITGKEYWRIESFNDDPATTHALVLQVLERARQNLAGGESRSAIPAAAKIHLWERLTSLL